MDGFKEFIKSISYIDSLELRLGQIGTHLSECVYILEGECEFVIYEHPVGFKEAHDVYIEWLLSCMKVIEEEISYRRSDPNYEDWE